jgi:hypothetical protein
MGLDMLKEYLPFLIPLVIAQLALGITALVHVLRHPHYRFGNKVVWAFIVMLVQIIGPVVYFTFGRGEE